jgi:hypothetical protein
MEFPPNDDNQSQYTPPQPPNTSYPQQQPYQQPIQPPPLFQQPSPYPPGYQQQSLYQPQQSAPSAKKRGRGLAVASLILMIVSTIFFIFAIPLGSAGVFLYVLAVLLNVATVVLLIILVARH